MQKIVDIKGTSGCMYEYKSCYNDEPVRYNTLILFPPSPKPEIIFHLRGK